MIKNYKRLQERKDHIRIEVEKLISKGSTKERAVQAMAKRLFLSERTIYNDLKSVSSLG